MNQKVMIKMNLNNIKIGTKIAVGAMLLVLITVILGIVAYNALSGVSVSIDGLKNNNAETVKNAVGVEVAAYDTMTQEKNYIIYETKVYSDATLQKSKEIYTALDKLDEIAKRYDNEVVLTKSKEARVQVAAFETAFEETVVILNTKSALETEMGAQGVALTNLYGRYIAGLEQDMAAAASSKKTEDMASISSQLAIANKGLEGVAAVRINNLKYWRAPSAETKKTVETNLQDLLSVLSQMEATTTHAEDKATIAEIRNEVTAYQSSVKEWTATEEKRAAAFPVLKAAIEDVIAKGAAAEAEGFAQLKQGGDATTNSAQSAMNLVVMSLVSAFVIGIMVALILAKVITKPINRIKNEAVQLGQTIDFSKKFTVSGTDEIGQMGTALNGMMDEINVPFNDIMRMAQGVAAGDLTVHPEVAAKGDILKLEGEIGKMINSMVEMITGITKSTETMASSAQELSASAQEVNASNEEVTSTIQQMAKGAQEQSKSLEETSKTIEKIAGNSKAVVAASVQTSTAAKSAGDSAKKGQELSGSATSKMKELAGSMNKASSDVRSLDEKGQKIGDIVSTITNIADQTNLLALNAAIEAARAGDAGRGFAVVADEVRKLAEESSTAAGQIEGIIKDMIESTKGTSQSMNESVKALDETNKVVGNALKELENIAEITEKLQDMAQDVSKKAQDAADGTTQVTDVVRTLSATAEENAAATEEVSASTEETAASMGQVSQAAQRLTDLSMDLSQVVSKFKLADSGTKVAKEEAKKAASGQEIKKAQAQPVKKSFADAKKK